MNMSKQQKAGIILTYIQIFLNVLCNLICIPFILRSLGDHEYGIYQLAASIISYVSIISLGFGSSYIRFYSRYKAKNDDDAIARMNALYFVVFLVMGAIALGVGLALSFNSQILTNETYSAKDLEILKTLMIFGTINLSLSFPLSVFNSYVTSQERFIFQKLLNILKILLTYSAYIVLLVFGFGSIGMVVALTIISFLIDIFNCIFSITKLKMKFKFGKIDGSLFKEIFIFSLFIAFNQIVDQLNNHTDQIILGKMISASAVAIYAVAMSIKSMYLQFSTAVSSVFSPQINRIIASDGDEKDKDKQITDLFIKVGRIQFFILMLVFSGFVFFGKYFINWWAGPDFELAYFIVLVLISSATVPLMQNIGVEVQRAKNKHQFRSIVYIIIAVTNIVVSIFLCKWLGIIGTAIGTFIADIIGTIIIMNIYYHKKLGINIIRFWKEILRASLGLIIPAGAGVAVMLFVTFPNKIVYFGCILAYALIYLVSIYLLGFNAEEKNAMKNLLLKFSKVCKLLFGKILLFIKKILHKIKLSKKKFVLIISASTTMDPHILQYYNSIKNENYKIKIVFWSGSIIDKEKYQKYGLDKNIIIFSKIKYLFSNPDLIVCADIYYFYQKAFSSKKLYLNHGSNTLAWGRKDIAYSYQYVDDYFDVYFETSKVVVENFSANENIKGRLVYSGNKFADEYKDMMSKRDEIRKSFGILDNQKVVFIAGSWKTTSLFHIIGKQGIDQLKELAKDNDYKFIVSIHPKEYTKYDDSVEPLGKYVDELENYGIIVRKPIQDFIPYIVASDLVVVDYSSMGDHAIMMGKDIIFSDFSDDLIFEYACSNELKHKLPVFKNDKEFRQLITSDYLPKYRKLIKHYKEQMDTPVGYFANLCIETTRKLLK